MWRVLIKFNTVWSHTPRIRFVRVSMVSHFFHSLTPVPNATGHHANLFLSSCPENCFAEWLHPLGISHRSLINVNDKRKVSLYAHFIRQSFLTSKLTIIADFSYSVEAVVSTFFKSRASSVAPITSFLNGYFLVWKVLFHRKYQQKLNSQP